MGVVVKYLLEHVKSEYFLYNSTEFEGNDFAFESEKLLLTAL